MLKHFIIYLKNIIFFKCAICFLCIFITLWVLQVLNIDYVKSINEYRDAEASLAEETLKLYSIINSEHKILETLSKYSQLLSISSRQNCQERLRIAAQIIALTTKYNLNKPITVNIEQEFSSDIYRVMEIKNDTIRIKNYSVEVNLSTRDFDSLMKIIEEIYSLMPGNTIVLSILIRNQEILTPSVIRALSTNYPPDRIYVTLNMRIREIAAKKPNNLS